MRDGVSTAGTLGIGLGVIGRLADDHDIHTEPGVGTVLVARFWSRRAGAGRGGGAAHAQAYLVVTATPHQGLDRRPIAPWKL